MNEVQILVLDFGSQYTQLIARRLRECGVYTEIVPYFESIEAIRAKNPKGLILSGGPASVYEKDAYKPDSRIFDLGIPILGICYGMQYIAHFFGGKVIKAKTQEFGKAILEIVTTTKTALKDFSIKTPRTTLRKFTKKDFSALKEILGDSATMYAWGHGFSNEEVQEWLNKQLSRYKQQGIGVWAVIEDKTQKLIGTAGLNYETISFDGLDKKSIVELSYIFKKEYWGQGYALECAKACLEYAFSACNLEEIYCLIKEDNFKSMKVARKLGMRIIGENIKNYRGDNLKHYLFNLKETELVFHADKSDLPVSKSYLATPKDNLKDSTDANNPLFLNVKQNSIVWMSHADKVEKIPKGFIELAKSGNTHYCAIANPACNLYALQFHPEVVHSQCGKEILENFAVHICKTKTDWNMQNFILSETQKIQQIVHKNGHKGKVLCAVSGGVDSSVVATLLYRAIGEDLIPVFVDTGLLRLGEREAVEKMFQQNLKVPLITVNASDIFLSRLHNITDPEKKRKIIGETFIEVFEKEAKKHNQSGEIKFLAQGTLYPDVIESVSIKGPSKTIKSHHNVGGLPKWMKFELIEPLRELFKDEVRALGRELGMPESMLMRHPFPGPGLAIRIMGEVNRQDLELLKQADSIFIEELLAKDFYNKVWQAFCVLLNVKSVGVMGDNRTYENTICLRAVSAIDGMTATFSHLPHDFLEGVANRIINEIEGINRVVYDITSKPPGTIEWE